MQEKQNSGVSYISRKTKCVVPARSVGQPYNCSPVSYTHLDVYKRQILGYMPLLHIPRVLTTEVLDQEPTPTVLDFCYAEVFRLEG